MAFVRALSLKTPLPDDVEPEVVDKLEDVQSAKEVLKQAKATLADLVELKREGPELEEKLPRELDWMAEQVVLQEAAVREAEADAQSTSQTMEVLDRALTKASDSLPASEHTMRVKEMEWEDVDLRTLIVSTIYDKLPHCTQEYWGKKCARAAKADLAKAKLKVMDAEEAIETWDTNVVRATAAAAAGVSAEEFLAPPEEEEEEEEPLPEPDEEDVEPEVEVKEQYPMQPGAEELVSF